MRHTALAASVAALYFGLFSVSASADTAVQADGEEQAMLMESIVVTATRETKNKWELA